MYYNFERATLVCNGLAKAWLFRSIRCFSKAMIVFASCQPARHSHNRSILIPAGTPQPGRIDTADCRAAGGANLGWHDQYSTTAWSVLGGHQAAVGFGINTC